MKQLSHYFSAEQGAAFARLLPELREKIGVTPFRLPSSDYGVRGNTFRAFPGWPSQPSKVYRQWAERVCNQLEPSSFEQQIGTKEAFRAWHAALADSLQQHWLNEQEGKALSFAHQYKLIDLFVKWLSAHDFGSRRLSECFISWGNCALDSQTLGKLNECLSMALPMSRPSMGDVHSMHTYSFCQDLIEAFAVNFGGSRLLFDYFAWRSGGGR